MSVHAVAFVFVLDVTRKVVDHYVHTAQNGRQMRTGLNDPSSRTMASPFGRAMRKGEFLRLVVRARTRPRPARECGRRREAVANADWQSAQESAKKNAEPAPKRTTPPSICLAVLLEAEMGWLFLRELRHMSCFRTRDYPHSVRTSVRNTSPRSGGSADYLLQEVTQPWISGSSIRILLASGAGVALRRMAGSLAHRPKATTVALIVKPMRAATAGEVSDVSGGELCSPPSFKVRYANSTRIVSARRA